MKVEHLLAVVFATAALGMAQPAAAKDDFLPPAETVGGIVFMSGGIGKGERDAMQALAKDYNLRLAFVAGERGAYLGGANVRIENSEGRVLLDTKALGPWFYARLPKGRYRVIASIDAGEISRDVNLTQRDADLVLRWPIKSDN